MTKTLAHYMSLDYVIEVKELHQQYGGGYIAMIPLLLTASLSGWGETPAKALDFLEKKKEEVFRQWLEEGTEIPEPSDDGYGREILLTLPASLHRKLEAISIDEEKELGACILGLLSNAVLMPR